MSDRLQTEPMLVPSSLPPRLETGQNELLSYPRSVPASEADADWMEEEDWLLRGNSDRYGTINEDNLQTALSRERYSRKRRGRRYIDGRKLESTTISSLTRLLIADNDSDEEEPPNIPMKYRRSGKDIAKLILLPVLYFAFMVVAIVFAFYTIQGLVKSYNNKVRSVQSIEVGYQYPAIGIAIFPQFSEFEHCEYHYYDNLIPGSYNDTITCDPKYNLPKTCTIINVTFNSTSLINVQRYAMIFKGPTLVGCKESLLLRFKINTTTREFSAVEYILFQDWNIFKDKPYKEQQKYLADLERHQNIFTFPAGFRTWIKMSYSLSNYEPKSNVTDFTIIDNYASYNGPYDNVKESYPMEVLFQWKNNYYDYITEIVSTTAWSAFGSMCGVFITLVKAAEFCRMWLRRIRRERQKKEIHLKKLEEEQKRLLESYEQRQKERRETKLRKSFEATRNFQVASDKMNFHSNT